MGDLLKNLQRIGDCELDDITVAHEALAEIVDLRLRIAELEAENARLRDTITYAKGRMKAYGIVDARVDLPGGWNEK